MCEYAFLYRLDLLPEPVESEQKATINGKIKRTWVEECNNCINPNTIGKNLGGLTYPGGNNPLTKNGDPSYSYVTRNMAEYPAIGHDRSYDNLKIKGASGLFLDTRAIGADWRFVGEELIIAANPLLNPIDKISAVILGVGLGLSALPKTFYQLSQPFGLILIINSYNTSNQGVNNTPTIHANQGLKD